MNVYRFTYRGLIVEVRAADYADAVAQVLAGNGAVVGIAETYEPQPELLGFERA